MSRASRNGFIGLVVLAAFFAVMFVTDNRTADAKAAKIYQSITVRDSIDYAFDPITGKIIPGRVVPASIIEVDSITIVAEYDEATQRFGAAAYGVYTYNGKRQVFLDHKNGREQLDQLGGNFEGKSLYDEPGISVVFIEIVDGGRVVANLKVLASTEQPSSGLIVKPATRRWGK